MHGLTDLSDKLKGGPGSGDWGHAGRPGKRGGSAGGGGLRRIGAKPGSTHAERREVADKYRSERKKPKKEKSAKNGSKQRTWDEARVDDLSEHYKIKAHCDANPYLCKKLQGYQSEDYHWINSQLRETGKHPNTQPLDNFIDSAARTPQDMKVYRQIDPEVMKSLHIGDTFTDKAYVSTTISKESADLIKELGDEDMPDPMGGSARLEIRVPEGSKGAYIADIALYPEEGEFLLPRNSKFNVVSRSGDDLVLELIDG